MSLKKRGDGLVVFAGVTNNHSGFQVSGHEQAEFSESVIAHN